MLSCESYFCVCGCRRLAVTRGRIAVGRLRVELLRGCGVDVTCSRRRAASVTCAMWSCEL